MNPVTRAFYWAALLVPGAVALRMVIRYGVNVPYWDQWELVPALIDLHNDADAKWSVLTDQHNEHRIFFPKLIMLVLARLTHWDIRAELLFGVGLAAATLGMLVALARPVFAPLPPAARIWAVGVLSMLVFSLTQYENWLWGWQITWFLCVLGAVASTALATWSLDRPGRWSCVAAAAGAAVVAQYSLAGGLFVWMTSAFILVFHPRRRLVLPVWILLAGVSTAIYLNGYAAPGYQQSATLALRYVNGLRQFIGHYLAGPLGGHAGLGMALGAAFLLLTLFLLHRRVRASLPWIALGVLVMANGLAAGSARLGYGSQLGLASRYITMGLLLTVAMVPMAVLALRQWPSGHRPRLRTAVGVGAAAVLTALIVAADIKAVPFLLQHNHRMKQARECMLPLDKATDECLKLLYPDPEMARRRSAQLGILGWSGFARDPEAPADRVTLTGSAGPQVWRLRAEKRSVGYISTATLKNGVLAITGWVHHPQARPSEDPRVVVTVDGVLMGEVEAGGARPDVAAVLGPAFRRSGWSLEVEGRAVSAALPRAKAYLRFADGILVPLDGETVVDRGS